MQYIAKIIDMLLLQTELTVLFEDLRILLYPFWICLFSNVWTSKRREDSVFPYS